MAKIVNFLCANKSECFHPIRSLSTLELPLIWKYLTYLRFYPASIWNICKYLFGLIQTLISWYKCIYHLHLSVEGPFKNYLNTILKSNHGLCIKWFCVSSWSNYVELEQLWNCSKISPNTYSGVHLRINNPRLCSKLALFKTSWKMLRILQLALLVQIYHNQELPIKVLHDPIP